MWPIFIISPLIVDFSPSVAVGRTDVTVVSGTFVAVELAVVVVGTSGVAVVPGTIVVIGKLWN